MKMKISVITLFPELIKSYLSDAILSKAITKSLLQINIINLRDFSDNKYKSVDDAPFGGGDGMVMRADILEKALLSILDSSKPQQVIYMSPQGRVLNSNTVKEYANATELELILIRGRYAGIDDRFIQKYVDHEISVGDYILSGGELPALILIEAISRFIPGVLGEAQSAVEDSFGVNEFLLEAPQYTRPQVWNELAAPDVLLSGNHKNIQSWKKQKAQEVTQMKRPDLYEKWLTAEKVKLK